KEQDSSLSAERFYKILIYTAYFGSWGLLPTNSTVIIPSQNTNLRRRLWQPLARSYCGNGHPLVRENLAISDGRWRCRRCGAARRTLSRAALAVQGGHHARRRNHPRIR